MASGNLYFALTDGNLFKVAWSGGHPTGAVTQIGGPLVAAGVNDDLVAVIEQRGGGVAAETLGGAGDEDAGHERAFCRVGRIAV